MAYLDLSKAFDMVDHELQVVKLKHYGDSVSFAKWLASYLSERDCRVRCNV